MESIYTTMKDSGTSNIVLGILLICGGVMSTICGGFIVASGAKLLKKKEELTI